MVIATHVTALFVPTGPPACACPLLLVAVAAGYPSPAEDYLEGPLNLHDYLVKHPAATFFVRVTGDSMVGAGIHPGDLLLVDRALTPRHQNVVIAVVDGDLTVKRLWHRDGTLQLLPDNGHYAPLALSPCTVFEVWGVVTHVIHAV